MYMECYLEEKQVLTLPLPVYRVRPASKQQVFPTLAPYNSSRLKIWKVKVFEFS